MIFSEAQTRMFLWLPVAFGVGIGLYFYLPTEPSVYWIYGLFSISTLGFIVNAISLKRYSLYAFLWCSLGFCLAFTRTHVLDTYMIDEFLKDLTVTGTILDIEDQDDSVRLIMHNLTFNNEANCHPAIVWSRIKKIRLKIAKSMAPPVPQNINTLVPGSLITVKATLIPFNGPVYMGGLDLRRQAYFDGLSVQGSVKEILSLKHGEEAIFQEKIHYYRNRLTHKLLSLLPKDTGNIAVALITGDRSRIDKKVRQEFVDAGIAHILAISGLHLSIIGGFVFFFIRGSLALFSSITERYPIKKIAANVVVLVTFAYLLISGSGYPVQRAFIMMSLGMVAIMIDRKVISMRLLAFAAFIVLMIRPESLLSASFQLSFAALVALVAFYEVGWAFLYKWNRHSGIIRKSLTYFLGIMMTTIVATLATTPFTIFFFNRFTLQALLGNTLAIPLTGMLIMPVAFMATTSLIFGGSTAIFYIFDKSLVLLKAIASFTASLPGAAIMIPSPHLGTLLLCVAGGLWLCLWQTKIRYAGVIFIAAGFIGFSIDQTPDILISKNVIAYKKDNTLYLSSKKGWFEKSMWQKHLGLIDNTLWDEPIQRLDHIVLIHDPRQLSKQAINELCYNADDHLFITEGYFPRYIANHIRKRGDRLIDRNDLKNQNMGVWLNKTRSSMKSPLVSSLNPTYPRPWG
ncbi:MAG: ComEC/Rec2 family competence protein [Alphaproteobacteria bacterium]|nr:ComEC/Rec2 family competence protein [Alphaproteobacteria bacterium]